MQKGIQQMKSWLNVLFRITDLFSVCFFKKILLKNLPNHLIRNIASSNAQNADCLPILYLLVSSISFGTIGSALWQLSLKCYWIMQCFAYLRMIVFKGGVWWVLLFLFVVYFLVGELRGSAVFDHPLELFFEDLTGVSFISILKRPCDSRVSLLWIFISVELTLFWYCGYSVFEVFRNEPPNLFATLKKKKKNKLQGQRIHLGIEKHLSPHFILKSCSILFKIVVVVKFIISSLCSFISYIVCKYYCDEIDKVKCISSLLCYIKRKCCSMEIVWSLHQFPKCRWEELLLI